LRRLDAEIFERGTELNQKETLQELKHKKETLQELKKMALESLFDCQ
jgi:hypothetical protein